MPHAVLALPPRILSGRLFLGQAPMSSQENLCAMAQLASPDAVARVFANARKEGCGGIMTLGDATVIAAMRRFRRGNPDFQILPIIPNVPGYVREATEYGMAGAGLRRLMRVGPLGFVRAALTGARHPLRVLRKDFNSLMAILYELEMSELGAFAPPAVFLHQTMTDLALAFGNRDFFFAFAERMRGKYHTEPGLVTANFVQLAARLREWDVPIRRVAAPLNRTGYLMPGGMREYDRILGEGGLEIVADRIAPVVPTPEDAIDWALAMQGVCSAIVERRI